MLDLFDSFVVPIGQFVDRVSSGSLSSLDSLILYVFAIGLIGFSASVLGRLWRF